LIFRARARVALAVVLLAPPGLAPQARGAPLTVAPSIAAPASAVQPAPIAVELFRDCPLSYAPDSAPSRGVPGVSFEENGRTARVVADLPEIAPPHRITALVTVRPVARNDREVFDRYDRAGSVRLATEGCPDVEVVRFITPYGGRMDCEVDVTHLAPLLRGRRTFRAHIDTWSSPAWRIDVALRYTPVAQYDAATWATPLYFTDSFNRQSMPSGDSVTVEIPPGLARVVLRYLSTGHCTDGTDADEFVSKANVIAVDGVVVARLHPWRDDCRRFRDRNPYCARWTDGSWSSDYSRSGWCPGVEVLPVEFDLTDHLTPGRHAVRFEVEDMRPKDEKGNFGYWRISAHLVGWNKPPALWRNE
jgi:hypothetical protein